MSYSLFILELVVKLFDYLRKPNSLFSKFCVICLLMFYFVYHNSFVLNDVNGACWCTCSMVALRVPHMHFWPAKTGNKLLIFEMHTCLWPGAQIGFRHKWRKLAVASLFFLCIDGCCCLRYWNEFFQLCFRFWLKFSRIALWRKRLQLHPKSDLNTNGLILGYFEKWLFSLTSYLYGLKFARYAQFFFLFWRHQLFSMFRLRGILVSSSKLFYFLAMGFCKIKWWALGMQCNFPYYSFVSSSLFLLEVVVKLFDYFWKPNSLFLKFCVNCLLIFYFAYCYNCVLNDVNGACW